MTDSVERGLARALTGHPTADPGTEAAAMRIVQIAQHYERAMYHVTARHGVSVGDCEIIWHLAHTQGDQRTPGQVAKAFHVTAGTMTSRLDRLERAGYIDRSIDAGNRAKIKVELTPAGHALHDATAGDMIEVGRDVIASALAPGDLATLNSLLQLVLAGIEHRAAPQPAGEPTADPPSAAVL